MAHELKHHQDWAYYDVNVKLVKKGNGIDSLKKTLPDNECGFAIFCINAENVGNTGKGIITEANIILQWKGPQTNGMKKNKCNMSLQTALSSLLPNKGYLEVLTRGKNLSVDIIYDKWRPGSGSKVIDD